MCVTGGKGKKLFQVILVFVNHLCGISVPVRIVAPRKVQGSQEEGRKEVSCVG